MKSANGIPFSYILALFENGEYVDETNFWFNGEPKGDMHYLGYLPDVDPNKPYWAGYCDIEGGFECATAKELFDAPYYNRKSLKDRWSEVNINEIGLISIEQFIEWYNNEFPIDSYE